MRAIKAAIEANNVDEIALQIRNMKRLWPEHAGLAKRREGEALTCEEAFRMRDKVLQLLPADKR